MKLLLAAAVCAAFCASAPAVFGADMSSMQTAPSLRQTAQQIEKLMTGSLSEARKESYRSISFADCTMAYNVLGTYPSGGLYDIRFAGLDFATLNRSQCSVGHDYTPFVTLTFDRAVSYRTDSDDLQVHTVVVNLGDFGQAQALYRQFLQLGELCAGKPVP